MTLRWWYLRRGVPWPAVLGCCAAAGLLTGFLARWPSAALVLLPGILACCAAAATFVFDERPVLLVAVTPRAAWRRTARLAVALVPLGVWAVVVLARPGDIPLHRGGWLLIGVAAISLSVGSAVLASRLEVPSPGAMIAPVVALAAICPVVVTAFLGWESVYPIGDFPRGIWVFWGGVAAFGVLAWVVSGDLAAPARRSPDSAGGRGSAPPKRDPAGRSGRTSTLP